MLYFYLLDSQLFTERTCPALAECWQRHSFEPARQFCQDLLPHVAAFVERYHLGPEEPLLVRVCHGLPFDRRFWRSLVGEVLLFSAEEIPEIQTAPESFCCLLAPDSYRVGQVLRESLAPIQQVHQGSHDLVLGGAFYRPEHAGWNDPDDVIRLAKYLESLNPHDWKATDLALMADVEEPAEELEFLRDWFPPLRDLYKTAAERKQVIVCEQS
jgi:hypothetical protein